MLSIRQIKPEEVDELHELLRKCGEDMRDRFGLSHWVPPYPLDQMRESTVNQRVYAVEGETGLVATFTLDTQAPPYYRPDIWEEPNAQAIYLHRLAVLPALQGQGIGSWCLKSIETHALTENYDAIRLDAFAPHRTLLKFYRKANYHWRATLTIQIPRRGSNDIACFEKTRRDFAGPRS
ncbi:GNAT family N-acetyltransferase [Ktedonospora formicarum]|nr:GNAT family N-acetyltransferase [Ktedonospora formicarum]